MAEGGNWQDELKKIDNDIQQALERLRGLPQEQIERILKPLYDQRQQLIQFGGVNFGQNNAVDITGPVVGGNVAGSVVMGNMIVNQPPDELSPADLRAAYLNRMVEMTGSLSLVGIDPRAASQAEAHLNLGAVYTALLTLESEEHQRLERGELPERAPRRLSALEQLDRQPRLVLLGDPGSGKSTFVNFVALCLAGEALGLGTANLALLRAPLPPEEDQRREKKKPQLQPWSYAALLPVRVVLRDFAARGLPAAGERATVKHLWNFICAELQEAALGDFEKPLHKELLGQGGLLLLDGLDEVPEAEQRRAQIKQCVEDFARTFPKCRILVTSRTYAYQKQDWRLAGFAEAVLAPFSRGQIVQFVQRWYDHIAALRNLNPQDAQGKAALLQRAILNSDRLLGLAERPLLLTLMASLHAWRGGTLPEKREELYADTVDLLLDWWESPKVIRTGSGETLMSQPSLVEWLKVDRQKVRGLLNELAFNAHDRQIELRGTADLAEGELVSGLMRLSQNPQVNPAQLVEYLSARAGLLVPRGVGVYTFPHRTFQEYLAACYLTDHDYPDQVAGLACNDPQRWREVALLASAKAGRGAASAVWDLVDALCYQPPSPTLEQAADLASQWGAHLAGQALVESIGLEQVSPRNQPRLERVRQWLVHILKSGALPALERAGAGNTLAALGDPRFRPDRWFLPDEPDLGFVRISAGPFWMGSDPKKDDQAREDEQPQHELSLPDYYLARFPVTVAQFRAFVQESGYSPAIERSLQGIANHPVALVTWYDALEYCRWLATKLSEFATTQAHPPPGDQEFWEGLSTGRLVVTLPSEAEWEKAASWAPDLPGFKRPISDLLEGGEPPPVPAGLLGNPAGLSGRKRLCPWGDAFDPNQANTAEGGIGSTSPVGCFPGGASPYGLLDLSGNVWEWTRSLWGKDWQKPDFRYPYDPADGREDLHIRDLRRVLRGGSFYDGAGGARCAPRDRFGPARWYDFGGFRVGVVAASPLPLGSEPSGNLGR